MNRFTTLLFPFALLILLTVGCENGNLTSGSNRKISDRELSQRMRDASMERQGRITVNGKVTTGYTIAIQGDSLEWYDGPNQQGKRHTAEVNDIGAVVIDHPHDHWPLFGAAAGLGAGALLGLELELNANAAQAPQSAPHINVAVPLEAAGAGAVLGFLGGTFLDPGIEENFWRQKIITPRPDSAK